MSDDALDHWMEGLIDSLCDAGHFDVVDAFFALGSAAYEGDLDAVEINFPVVLGHARAEELPWLELYARHLRLQAYVNTGVKLDEMLPEAASLVAFSATGPVSGCPSVRCPVQDLSLCFGGIDGPGFAEERLAAIAEVTAGLDPSITCFACFTQETVDTLNHMGRFDEALVHASRAAATAREAGEPIDEGEHYWNFMGRDLFRAAIGAGRLDEAGVLLDKVTTERPDNRVWVQVSRAQLAHARGDAAGAAQALPGFAGTEEGRGRTRSFWLAVAAQMGAIGALDGAEAVVAEARDNGRARDAFDGACAAAKLALRAGDEALARRWVDEASGLRGALRGSHGADEDLAALGALAG